MKSNLRYGIRKHKLGAASVFLGTMIVVGMGQEKEAAASEQNNTTVEESGSSATESKVSETQTTTNNVNTIDETQSYSATSTEQPSQSTQVTTEEAPKTVQAPKVETSRVDLPSEKVADKETTGTQVDIAQPSNVSEIKPRMKRSTDVAVVAGEAKATGTDVTNKVTVENGSEIVGHKQDTNVVNPHNAERVTLKYKWKFGEGIKEGDYFDFTLSDNVETHGISTLRKVPEIKSTDGQVMAIGEVVEERKIRYTFKEYVKDKKDLTAELSLNLFIDPTTVTKQGKQKVEVTLGDKTIEKEFDIKYLDGVKDRMGVTVNGRIDTLNKEDGKFSHFAYIKPNNRSLSSVTVTGQVTSGHKQNANNPTVKVYKHIGSDELAESVYAKLDDANKFEDVTNKVNLSYTGDGGYSLNFNDLDNTKNYVIKYEGEYNQNAKDLNFRTHLSGYHKNYPYYPYYPYYPVQLTWKNGVAFYSNNAQGDGKDKPNDPIIEKSEPIDLDIKSEPPVEKHELTGTIEESNDSKPIDFEYHTAVEGAEGHAEGIIETEEDSIHVDFEESTHENSKHHADVVEYEEDTNPGGGQVTTESNLVEFDEDYTKGIVTGAVSDHTTVEDTKEYTTESNLIELVDELPEEHGQAQGPIEEITENYQHISHSGLGTENGHGNYGVIEEIEENSHVDIKSELGYEGGQNSGNQSFEEDTEEDKPKYEQGGNIVDIDFDSVPQIQGQNNGDQSFEEDTEEDKPKYEQGGNIIDIDFDSVPHIHGFNKHTEIIEEDTNKDKPNYQFGGHSSVDFEEDTLPQVSGHNEGQQTIEEDTTPPIVPPTPPTPEVPSEPEVPTPPTPEIPSEPGKPVPPAKEEPKKPSKPVEQGKVVTPVIEINEKVKAVAPTKKAQSKKSELPETGGEESTNKGMLFGGLFSILGLALLRRNKKNHKA
ncbi:fibronectin-binding protein FnbB [Staphylococcus sp. MZ3]|uniref:fibrinogen-binding adhesin SdrG C-terminal domain-containing protein n=1 Tax=unclassified Staphylococcus TaxID=91994 RepID=UPI001BE77569|nr:MULTISPECIES: fibrinogen-binding adhesin SdrG C-terminal domain-containing protein [unclassified Staphylococcus]QWB97743.1 fibronectin-binding protein FnbB [Staphylococcus sp. MZ8]QWC01839.1 fibronectin-binding protein FnbB [Staphylococcus sp. MZ3]QWC04406.1 fibronectin-binding protein FnbB [Staphylococcus sp. MZ1]QWC06541.1 fibronectin-binding protein FnbB [Staphylococcus sp. MZ9]QWC12952.1 fibronectin-binding protein FnbB [Staphylococcus sp. MZ7]